MKLKTIAIPIVFMCTILIAQDNQNSNQHDEANPYWPMNVIFTNATTASFADPYNKEKSKVAKSIEDTNNKLMEKIDSKRDEFETLFLAEKKDRKKIIQCTKELYALQIDLELANMEARKKMDDIDRKMVDELTGKVNIWTEEMLKDESKYKRFINELKPD
ncbi:MAG: hypothetical protein JXK07_02535 [Spirochaetes bacterium]|nr:hypothetical protein [Spirochaetota bacterium]MBN2771930.1 hypothetical protein [Spirochaetota bacterium]